MTSAPLRGGVDRPPKAHTPSPECHPLHPAPRSSPVRREAKEVEGRAPRIAPAERRTKRKASCLLRVEGQPVFRKPLPEDIPHAPRVIFMLEAEDEVVRVPHERSAPAESWLDLV